MIKFKYVKNGLPLINNSNCDTLHRHNRLEVNSQNRFGFDIPEDPRLITYKYNNNDVITMDRNGNVSFNVVNVRANSPTPSPPAQGSNLIFTNNEFYYYDPVYNEYLSVNKGEWMFVYNNITSATVNTYYWLITSTSGILLPYNIKIIGLTIRLGQYIASTYRRNFSITSSGTIVWSVNPPFSATVLDYINMSMNVNLNVNNYINFRSDGVGGTTNIDRWGYLVFLIYYRRRL